MIVSDRLVFLHLHKSGGTFINNILLECVPGATKLGHHMPASQLPERYRALPVLGSVRKPWDYYVSWCTFQNERREYVWRTFSENGALDFSQTVERMLRAGEDDALLDRLIEQAPAEFPREKVNLTKGCIESIRGRDCGWYTFLFERMYGDLDVRYLRVETLRSDFLAAMRDLDLATPELVARTEAAPRANTTSHDPYPEYYDSSLSALVAQRDRAVIERFGYSF